MTRRSPRQSEWLIPLCALLVSAAALGVAVYEGWSSRAHQRLSVRPYVLLDFGINENEAGWWIGNEGLGPAVVAWSLVTVDGQPCVSWGDVDAALDLPPSYHVKYSNPLHGYPIKSGERLEMFRVVDNESAVGALLRGRSRVAIEVCYCSFYDECWKTRLATEGPTAHVEADCSRPPTGYFGARDASGPVEANHPTPN
jgi:hypothetical protein